jgi:hypothetical protein
MKVGEDPEDLPQPLEKSDLQRLAARIGNVRAGRRTGARWRTPLHGFQPVLTDPTRDGE